MRIRVRNQQDLLAGLLFLAIAAGALVMAWSYPVGTAIRMSSGYFPRVLGLLLGAIGAFVFVRALAVEGPAVTRVRLRPALFITAAVVVFAYSIQTLGVLIASVLITMIGAFASPKVRPLEALAAAVLLALLVVAIFIWGIGLPIPLWPDL